MLREDALAVEIRHLKYIIAAADYGSFRRAAAVLHVRESAISRRIRAVEDELGVALFTRDHSGVRLTQGGERFIGRARRALTQITYATIDVGSFGRGETGIVRIGIFTSLSSGFLADLLRRFVHKYPRVRPELVEGGPAQHVSAVVRNQLDVAFLTGEPSAAGCERLPLWNERVFVALPADDALVERQEISWSELRGRRFIVSESDQGLEIQGYLVKHLAELGRHPSVTRHRVARENLLNLVAMKQGLTVTTEATIASLFPGVVYRPLMNETLPFCAIWAINNDNPALHRLLSLARLASRNWLPENDFPIHTRRRVATSPGAIA